MVDTCAAEFPAETPYFYATYDEENEAAHFIEAQPKEKKTVLVFGSGPIRIGQGIEFDYSSVHCVWALKKAGYEVVIVNNNPETVSTDYTTSDKLYFEPLCVEDVMNVIQMEQPDGVIASLGGQTAINLAKPLDRLTEEEAKIEIYPTVILALPDNVLKSSRDETAAALDKYRKAGEEDDV